VTLEERILDAHERGDSAELRRLQDEYRRTRNPDRIAAPGFDVHYSLERGHWQERPRGGGRVERTWIPDQTPTRSRQASSSPPSVTLRETAAPSFVVRLHGESLTTIEREARNVFSDFDSFVETGGWLYGLRAPRDGRADVCFATGPGELGWTCPRVHAWVTKQEGAGFVCEPARLDY